MVRQSVDKKLKVVVIDKITYAGDLKRIESCKNKIKLYKTDIINKKEIEKIFEKENPDTVIHMAAETHVDRSIKDAETFIDTNVKGTNVLLNVARNSGVKRFINISTDEVYGALGKGGQFHEDTPLDPKSPYSASKASADMLGRAYFHTHRLPVITVRPCNYYGPWQYPEKLIPVMITKAYNNEPLPVYGKGENVREWLYIADCADAIFKLVEKGKPGEIYNLGSSQEQNNISVVNKILEIMKKPTSLITFVTDRPGHDFRYSLNTDKTEKEIGFKAKVTFEEGIQKTVDWYIKNMEWVDSKLEELKEYWATAYYE